MPPEIAEHSQLKRILLLNPPGKRSYLRDYYCSSISKAGYYWPPIDLLVLSGLLKNRFDVHVLDAIIQRRSFENCAKDIKNIGPEIIIFLSSTQSYRDDFPFMRRIKRAQNAVMIGCGEIFLEDSQKILKENSFLDGVILDFTNPNIVDFLKSPSLFSKALPKQKLHKNKPLLFTYPTPLHETFPLRLYRYPHNRSNPFTSVLTTYGCPRHCHFCNSGNLGFKRRNLYNIVDELKEIRKQGIKQVFFADMTFGESREHTLQLCDAIFNEGIDISWNCYSRVDVVDEQLLIAMRRAGCRLVQYGIENIDQHMLKKYGKNISLSRVKNTFELMKKQKILSGAHFLFGLSKESPDSVKESIRFIHLLKPDYVSFNIFYPRKSSRLSQEPPPDNLKLLQKYIRKGYLQFYLSPSYLASKLLGIRSVYEFNNLLYMGKMLCRHLVTGRI